MAVLGFHPRQRPLFPSHVQWTGDNAMLSPPEVKAVVDFAESQKLYPGTIGNGGGTQGIENPSYRSVETCSIPVNDDLTWLYTRVMQKIEWANDEYYRFQLTGLTEPLGYLKYTPATDTKPAGHYDWHQDFGGGPYSTRKLSLIIQLSNADEYDGCELNLCNEGPWTVQYKNAGDAIMFPSWTPHYVTPITRGVRKALVLWVHGEQFR